MIDSFSGQYCFLSNFFPCEVHLDGYNYVSVEHAYQAAKTLDLEERDAFLDDITPGEAKRLGRAITLRPDWEDVKLDVMEDLLRQKFNHPRLKTLLLETEDHELVEGNHWGDTFWGVCHGVGENHLGRLLMQIRSEVTKRKKKKGSL